MASSLRQLQSKALSGMHVSLIERCALPCMSGGIKICAAGTTHSHCTACALAPSTNTPLLTPGAPSAWRLMPEQVRGASAWRLMPEQGFKHPMPRFVFATALVAPVMYTISADARSAARLVDDARAGLPEANAKVRPGG